MCIALTTQLKKLKKRLLTSKIKTTNLKRYEKTQNLTYNNKQLIHLLLLSQHGFLLR